MKKNKEGASSDKPLPEDNAMLQKDKFWLEYAEALVKDAEDSRIKAAEKIQELAVWLWGLFTASTYLGITFSESQLTLWQAVLIAMASASIIVLYWAVVFVQIPIDSDVSFEIPNRNETAYKNRVKSRRNRLRWSIALSLLAAILVSASLTVVIIAKDKQKSVTHLDAQIRSTPQGQILALTSTPGVAPKVDIDVMPVDTNDVAIGSEKYYFTFVPTEQGLIQTSIPLKTDATRVKVILQWRNSDDISIQLSKVIVADRPMN